MAAVANCGSCGTEIEWTVTEAGKSMPVDAGEDPEGNVIVIPSRKGRGASRSRAVTGAELPMPGERRTVSHYATCPDAKEWRERGTGRA